MPFVFCYQAFMQVWFTSSMSCLNEKQIGESVALRGQLLNEQVTYVLSDSLRSISEEVPFAYGDIDIVVDAVHEAGVALKLPN